MKKRGGSPVAFAALGLLLGALLACKQEKRSDPTPAQPTELPRITRFKELSPKTKALLSKLPTLAEKAKSEPAVKKDEPLTDKLDKKQYTIIGDRWLSDLKLRAESTEIDLDSSVMSLCSFAVEKRPEATKDSDLDKDNEYMEECTGWEYVAVVRPKDLRLPKVNMSAKTFTPGRVGGDMLVFRISSSEVVARYRFGTTNSDEITVVEGKPEAEWVEDATRDLGKNLRGVIEERLAQERDSMGE